MPRALAMKLQEQLEAVLAGTHVLVQLEGEHQWDGKVAVVPREVFEQWKEALRRKAGSWEWPKEITGTVNAYLADDAILEVRRVLLTYGDDSGLIDGEEDYRINWGTH